jgi:hypothetical protein
MHNQPTPDQWAEYLEYLNAPWDADPPAEYITRETRRCVDGSEFEYDVICRKVIQNGERVELVKLRTVFDVMVTPECLDGECKEGDCTGQCKIES